MSEPRLPPFEWPRAYAGINQADRLLIALYRALSDLDRDIRSGDQIVHDLSGELDIIDYIRTEVLGPAAECLIPHAKPESE